MNYPVIGFVGTIPEFNYPVLSSTNVIYKKEPNKNDERFYVSWFDDMSKDIGVTEEELRMAIQEKQVTIFNKDYVWTSPGRSGSIISEECYLRSPREILLQVRGFFQDFICQGIGPVSILEHEGAKLMFVDAKIWDIHLENKSQTLTQDLLDSCSEDELRVLSCGLPFNEMLAQARINRTLDPVKKARVQRIIDIQRNASIAFRSQKKSTPNL